MKQNKTERSVYTKNCFGKPLTNYKAQGREAFLPQWEHRGEGCVQNPNIKALNTGPKLEI